MFEDRSPENAPNPVFFSASITLLIEFVKAIGIGSVAFSEDANRNAAGTLPMILTHAAKMAFQLSENGDALDVVYIPGVANGSCTGTSTGRNTRSPAR